MSKLPESVIDCLRDEYLVPGLEEWFERAKRRLENLPVKVWVMGIDWSRHAGELDSAARVIPVSRAVNEEKKAHDKIARTLRKAAGALRLGGGQVDPLLLGALQSVAELDHKSFGAYVPDLRLEQDSPRLSDFLRTLAAWIEGEQLQSFGFHRVTDSKQQVGSDGAALAAQRQVTDFMMRVTGKPHHEIVSEIIEAYYPTASRCDRARSTRNGKIPPK